MIGLAQFEITVLHVKTPFLNYTRFSYEHRKVRLSKLLVCHSLTRIFFYLEYSNFYILQFVILWSSLFVNVRSFWTASSSPGFWWRKQTPFFSETKQNSKQTIITCSFKIQFYYQAKDCREVIMFYWHFTFYHLLFIQKSYSLEWCLFIVDKSDVSTPLNPIFLTRH